MSRLTQTPPLISLNPGPIGPLQVHVHEPFRHRQGSKKTRAALNLLDLLGRLELVFAKQKNMRTFQPTTEQVKELEKTLEHEIELLKSMIESTWQQLDTDPYQENNNYIQEMNLAALYPLSIQHLKCATPTERGQLSMAGANIHSHYHQMALYDQLYATAARLYRSLNLNDHHYIPYQLAIAFQCVNQLGMYYTEYRERIQRKFDEIKQALSTHSNKSNKTDDTNHTITATLNDEQVVWLKQLATDLMEQVLYGKDNTDPMKSNRYTLLTEAMVQTQKMGQKEKASSPV
ncbi:hypothetical protein BDA99DRAFT_104754 [Phascolomyces articulosus]|uniref:Uncharacterized protein n=1 Tax=Phascolomyces articulosus TaxID=60185 RepID=A0AAD5PCT4_9FUNG|nr:hypothetical protein BDA99DRAFT_104754 [Phascolomyces articulosus]